MGFPTARYARVPEDSDSTLLARVCFRDAGGAASPEPEEGNLIIDSDLSEIEVTTTNLDDSTVAEIVDTISSGFSTYVTTLNTTGIWLLLQGGGNFLYDLPRANIPTGGTNYRVEAKFTTTGSKVGFARWHIFTGEIQGS